MLENGAAAILSGVRAKSVVSRATLELSGFSNSVQSTPNLALVQPNRHWPFGEDLITLA